MQYLSLPSYGADVSISLLIYASSFAMFLSFDFYSSAGFVILDYGQLPGLPPYVLQPHFSTGPSCTPGVSFLASHFIQCETDTFIRHCTRNIFLRIVMGEASSSRQDLFFLCGKLDFYGSSLLVDLLRYPILVQVEDRLGMNCIGIKIPGKPFN